MTAVSPLRYRRTTDLAADAMINEGGAIHQPSRAASDEALQHVRGARGDFRCQMMRSPLTAFWAGFAAGLAVFMLERHWRSKH